MAKYPKEKKQKEMEEDNKVHESKSPEQILKELIDAYAKDKTVKKPVPSISQFEQGKFRRKTQPYQGEKPEKAEKSEQVQKNIGLPLMTSEKEEAQKAEDKKYPKKLGAKNVEAHMKRLKEDPSKYPGGKKQAIAIGLSQARAGEKEPMPKAEIEKAGEMPAGAAKPKMPKMPVPPAMPSKKPMAAAQKQAQLSAGGKQMMPKMPKPAAPKKQAAPPMATKSEEMEKAKVDEIKTPELEQKIKSLIDSHKKEQRAARKPEIKGVHTEEGTYQKLPKGLENVSSKYGSVISNQPYKDKWSSISDQLKGAQKVASKRKQEEIKKMPAPKLAASEEKIVKNQFVVTEVELNSKCTDCNKPQFTLTKNEHKFTPCICYASENQGKEPFVKLIKSEGGTKLYFNSKADPESVKSFLLTLKLGLLAKKISK